VDVICAPADIDCDGIVNILDLLGVIGAWGFCVQPPQLGSCPADISPEVGGDGEVNVQDLLMVIQNWG
jgi:hypothetical protein